MAKIIAVLSIITDLDLKTDRLTKRRCRKGLQSFWRLSRLTGD